MLIKRITYDIIYIVNISFVADTSFSTLSYNFINGGGEEYRVMFLLKRGLNSYTESLIVNPDLDNESSAKRPMFVSLVNLGDNVNEYENKIYLGLHPNPAEDVVYITAFTPASSDENRLINIEIVNQLGSVVFKTKARPGEELRVALDDIPNGLYYVRSSINSGTHGFMPGVKTLIIER